MLCDVIYAQNVWKCFDNEQKVNNKNPANIYISVDTHNLLQAWCPSKCPSEVHKSAPKQPTRPSKQCSVVKSKRVVWQKHYIMAEKFLETHFTVTGPGNCSVSQPHTPVVYQNSSRYYQLSNTSTCTLTLEIFHFHALCRLEKCCLAEFEEWKGMFFKCTCKLGYINK